MNKPPSYNPLCTYKEPVRAREKFRGYGYTIPYNVENVRFMGQGHDLFCLFGIYGAQMLKWYRAAGRPTVYLIGDEEGHMYSEAVHHLLQMDGLNDSYKRGCPHWEIPEVALERCIVRGPLAVSTDTFDIEYSHSLFVSKIGTNQYTCDRKVLYIIGVTESWLRWEEGAVGSLVVANSFMGRGYQTLLSYRHYSREHKEDCTTLSIYKGWGYKDHQNVDTDTPPETSTMQ